MSGNAKQRVEALGKQLAPGSQSGSLPPVTKVAGASNGPRLQGKVAIVTGMYPPATPAAIGGILPARCDAT